MSNEEEIRELVSRVQAGLRITKVVATRSVKGRLGETQAGFSGELALSEPESQSMTLREAIVANCLLAREADLAAMRNAIAGGNVSLEYGNDAIALIKANYGRLLVESLGEIDK